MPDLMQDVVRPSPAPQFVTAQYRGAGLEIAWPPLCTVSMASVLPLHRIVAMPFEAGGSGLMP